MDGRTPGGYEKKITNARCVIHIFPPPQLIERGSYINEWNHLSLVLDS